EAVDLLLDLPDVRELRLTFEKEPRAVAQRHDRHDAGRVVDLAVLLEHLPACGAGLHVKGVRGRDRGAWRQDGTGAAEAHDAIRQVDVRASVAREVVEPEL